MHIQENTVVNDNLKEVLSSQKYFNFRLFSGLNVEISILELVVYNFCNFLLNVTLQELFMNILRKAYHSPKIYWSLGVKLQICQSWRGKPQCIFSFLSDLIIIFIASLYNLNNNDFIYLNPQCRF